MQTSPGESTHTQRLLLYESSTQFKHWRYSPETLVAIRTSLNNTAVGAIREKLEVNQPNSSAEVAFLAADEEYALVRHYFTKITQLCLHFHFPDEVEATAVTYMKRFYLKNTVMDWHPKNVMLTALFLATKTTNNAISIEAYAKDIPKTTPSDVLDLEFLVAQSLNFEFTVWHAHRALWGLWLDLQNLVSESLDRAMYEKAYEKIRLSRLTDAELIYIPSQIALAALCLAAPDLSQQWLSSKVSDNGTDGRLALSAMQNVIGQIQHLIESKSAVPGIDVVRVIDRRLKTCKNPEKVIGSKLYLAKKAEEEHKAEERRNKKAETIRQSMKVDPFGSALPPDKPGLVDYDDDDDD